MSEDRKEPAEVVIPVIEERLVVERRERETGAVRVRKRAHEEQHLVDEPVVYEDVDIKRIPVKRWVETLALERTEGDTVIIPLHREVLVVERRLQVFEELHITPRQRKERHRETVAVRHEEAIVEWSKAPAEE